MSADWRELQRCCGASVRGQWCAYRDTKKCLRRAGTSPRPGEVLKERESEVSQVQGWWFGCFNGHSGVGPGVTLKVLNCFKWDTNISV